MGVKRLFKNRKKWYTHTDTHTDGHPNLETELAQWANSVKILFVIQPSLIWSSKYKQLQTELQDNSLKTKDIKYNKTQYYEIQGKLDLA